MKALENIGQQYSFKKRKCTCYMSEIFSQFSSAISTKRPQNLKEITPKSYLYIFVISLYHGPVCVDGWVGWWLCWGEGCIGMGTLIM